MSCRLPGKLFCNDIPSEIFQQKPENILSVDFISPAPTILLHGHVGITLIKIARADDKKICYGDRKTLVVGFMFCKNCNYKLVYRHKNHQGDKTVCSMSSVL